MARHKGIFIIIVLISILIILSQNFFAQGTDVFDVFDWVTYDSISGTVWVCWQDSFLGAIIPYLAYFPTIAGALGIIGGVVVLKEEGPAKIILKIAGVLAILAYALFAISGFIFTLIGNPLPLPNLPGAYICLIGGIVVLILSISINKPEYLKGYAPDEKDYYAIEAKPSIVAGPEPSGLTMQCPHCGAIVSANQLFCEQCGEYF
ncbi:MAG: hypothetical protein ACTSQI_13760 [Candidatus Helarchaeota archaeon]